MQHLVGKWKVVSGVGCGGCGAVWRPAISSVVLLFILKKEDSWPLSGGFSASDENKTSRSHQLYFKTYFSCISFAASRSWEPDSEEGQSCWARPADPCRIFLRCTQESNTWDRNWTWSLKDCFPSGFKSIWENRQGLGGGQPSSGAATGSLLHLT